MTYATNLLWRQASAIYAAASAHTLPISFSFFLFLFRFLLLTCALSHLKSLQWTKLTGEWKEIAAVLPSTVLHNQANCFPTHIIFYLSPLPLSLSGSLSGSLSETSLMHLSNMAHIYICRENCIIPYAMLPLYDFCAYFTLLPKLLPINSLAFFWSLCSALVCKTLHS